MKKVIGVLSLVLAASVAYTTAGDTGMVDTGMMNTGMMNTWMMNTGMMNTWMTETRTGETMTGMTSTTGMTETRTGSMTTTTSVEKTGEVTTTTTTMSFEEMLLAKMSTRTEDMKARFQANLMAKEENNMTKIMLTDEAKIMRKGLVSNTRQPAIDFLYKNGLTRYATESEFRGNDPITREQASKFFGEFAKTVMGVKADESKDCSFNDSKDFDSTLVTNIKEACQMGLFKGSEGKFMPTQPLTNGQALTVLIRLVGGKMRDENMAGKHWATVYKMIADKLGLTMGLDASMDAYLDKQITRGDMAKMIEAASFIKNIQETLGATDVANISVSADGTFTATTE